MVPNHATHRKFSMFFSKKDPCLNVFENNDNDIDNVDYDDFHDNNVELFLLWLTDESNLA